MAVAPWIVSDGLWERIEPLLPKRQRRLRYPGRTPLPDRAALQGILFVLHTGIAWRHLPLELGFGSGSTCYRRMVAWQQAGVWERLHPLLLAELRAAGALEWLRAVVDSSHVQAKKGAPRRGRARLTEPDAAPSITSWSTPPASRSPGRSPAATATASPNSCHWWSACRRCAARSAGRAAGLSASPLIGGMTTTSTGASSAGAGSRRRSHAARPSTAPGSAAPAGSSSAPSPGCTSSSGSSSATTAATRSMKPSSPSAAASSASADSATHCDSSS
jgi:transposase